MSTPLGTRGAKSLRVCVGSDYNDGMKLYNGLCFEACEAISAMADVTLLAPEAEEHGPIWKSASLAKHALTGVPLSKARHHAASERFDLFFYICMRPQNLTYLQSMESWRERSGKAIAFIFETWSAQAHRFRHYLRLLDQFDHVFLFNPASVTTVQRYTTAKCSYLPAAVDCLRATPYPNPLPRPIDIFSMGRTDESVHAQLMDLAQQKKLLYIWDQSANPATNGYARARFRTYNFIRNTRMFTSFNFATGDRKVVVSNGEDAIPARVFEAAAAGAVMIGTSPRVSEFSTLFDWPDALIEIPMDPVDMATFYSDLQRQPERIRRAGIMNAAQSLRRHDWVHRWEEILRTVDLPVPTKTEERKAALSALADAAEDEL